jgi:outer membrane protein TolC
MVIITIAILGFYKKVYIPKHTFATTKATKGSINIKVNGVGNVGARDIYKIGSLYGGKILDFSVRDLPDQQNQLMLSFSLNLYDSSSSNKKQSAILAKMAKKEQLNYAISKEKIDFSLATKKLATQRAKIDSVKSALDMAVSVYEIILTKYQNGVVDNITYLDALSKKTINQSLYIQALNNYEIAKADYYFSSGVSYKKMMENL